MFETEQSGKYKIKYADGCLSWEQDGTHILHNNRSTQTKTTP